MTEETLWLLALQESVLHKTFRSLALLLQKGSPVQPVLANMSAAHAEAAVRLSGFAAAVELEKMSLDDIKHVVMESCESWVGAEGLEPLGRARVEK